MSDTVADVVNVQTVLPKKLEDVVSRDTIQDYLEIASLKVDEYSVTGDDQKWAEAYYCAYRIAKDKYPLPISEDEGGVQSEYSEDPAQSLHDKFKDIVSDDNHQMII